MRESLSLLLTKKGDTVPKSVKVPPKSASFTKCNEALLKRPSLSFLRTIYSTLLARIVTLLQTNAILLLLLLLECDLERISRGNGSNEDNNR